MEDCSLFESVVLRSIATAMVMEAFGDAIVSNKLYRALGVSESIVVDMVLETLSQRKEGFTEKDCIDTLSGKYVDNFNPSQCVVYHHGKFKPSWACNHKHCGRPLTSEGICSMCIGTVEGTKVLSSIRSGMFDASEYRKSTGVTRAATSKLKLRSLGVDHYYLAKRLFVATSSGNYYCPELDITVNKTTVNGVDKSITVGEGRSGTIKLSRKKLAALKDTGITVHMDSLAPDCLKEINAKIEKSCA